MSVERLEIRARGPYEDGKTFGETGAYERIDGRLHFAVDPLHAANAPIVDLDKAPRDAAGRVHFTADFCLLQPADAAKGSGRLLYDVLNRGGKPAVKLNCAPRPAVPTDRIDPGDGLLFRRGWSLVWGGWQWDVKSGPGLMALQAPEALAGGRPIAGEVAIPFQPDRRVPHKELGHSLASSQMRPYPVADLDQPDAVLTVRAWREGPRTPIARERWRFARVVDGRVVPDDTHIWLEGGFEPGCLYEVVYRTRVCPVAGTGLLSMRDTVSFLRYADAAAGNPAAARIAHTYGFGVSQSGRFLRHFVYLGLNLDEAGRQVFDGLLPEVAGARRGEFNHRYAQPSITERPGFGYLPPFADDSCVDPFSGVEDGLLRRQRELGGVPKLVQTNTAAEYWGFAGASLVHTDPAGMRDVEPPGESRIYTFAGTQHGPGMLEFLRESPTFSLGGNPFNAVDSRPLTRAALINLDLWVAEGIEPPPSAFPRLADGTAVPPETVLTAMGAIPGVARPDPERLLPTRSLDLGPDAARGIGRYPAVAGATYPTYVSAVDGDGNELAGIRLPELTVPVASYTGWNPRDPAIGGEGQLALMAGSTLPFAVTKAERERRGDPRPAIAERYRDRDDYAARARTAAERLAAERYILTEDIDLAVANALARYDAFAGVTAGAAAR